MFISGVHCVFFRVLAYWVFYFGNVALVSFYTLKEKLNQVLMFEHLEWTLLFKVNLYFLPSTQFVNTE